MGTKKLDGEFNEKTECGSVDWRGRFVVIKGRLSFMHAWKANDRRKMDISGEGV